MRQYLLLPQLGNQLAADPVHKQVECLGGPDVGGEILQQCRINHNGQAITEFLRSLNDLAKGQPGSIAMAIEVPHGPVVEAFLEGGFAVFSINPKQLDRFRDRYTAAGAKDDSRDAYVAAAFLAHRSTLFSACRSRSRRGGMLKTIPKPPN